MALLTLRRKAAERAADSVPGRWIEPRLGPAPRPSPKSEVFDSGARTIVDCAHVKVERLDTQPVLFSKVFKEFEDRKGHRYDYRYWAERENYFLREFLKKQGEFRHVVQARHLISENEAAKQVLTCDAGITIANWLRVKARYADTSTLSHPFQRADVFLQLVRACLVALRELHEHRIVHCDIKEDNICIPYSPYPFTGEGEKVGDGKLTLAFGRLKVIDFAFSVAHSIPLTQVLVIDPDERLPYQSELLVAALRADRKSGSPNAVQQLDYRVDLFSLGHMAEKIAAAGLVCPRAAADTLSEEVLALVRRLKAYDQAPLPDTLPHAGLIAEIDRLLDESANPEAHAGFDVDGEWSAEDMAHGRIAGRQTPLTPVALPLPTPIARPVTPAVFGNGAWNWAASLKWLGLFGGVALVAATIAAFVHYAHPRAPEPALAPLAAAAPDPARIAAEAGNGLASAKTHAEKARAFGRLLELAKHGNDEAAKRVSAFETHYDEVKQTVAKSEWWAKGHGSRPEGAARWMEDGRILAEFGDRPAVLDLAFATGYGRSVAQDRAMAAELYLKVIDRSEGKDEASKRVRLSADRGLSATLNAIVEQKDAAAATRLRPGLEARAAAGSAGVQYYLGLISECVAEPADLEAARQLYAQSAGDPAWKAIAERKSELLGRWCPQAR
jgi:hypothetical protein